MKEGGKEMLTRESRGRSFRVMRAEGGGDLSRSRGFDIEILRGFREGLTWRRRRSSNQVGNSKNKLQQIVVLGRLLMREDEREIGASGPVSAGPPAGRVRLNRSNRSNVLDHIIKITKYYLYV